MGSALAQAMLKAGHQVTVWNRTSQRAERLVEMGAQKARSFADALAASPVVVICIDSYASTWSLLEGEGLADCLGGRTIVNLTTGTPRDAKELSGWVAAKGAGYLDGAILCGPDQIGTQDGEVLFSGDVSAWQIAAPLVRCLAGKVRHVGPGVGDAAALDLAWLTMFYAKFIGVAHAARICSAQGIDLEAFAQLFPDDPYAGNLARIIKTADYGHPTATLQVWGAALARIQTQAREAGIPSAIPDFIAGYFQRAVGMGLGHEQAIAIYKTLLKDGGPA